MRSMDTAPRDGTRIIIWDEMDGLPHCAHWDGEDWFMCDVPDIDEIIDVAHPLGWAHLPAECFEEEGASK